MLDVPCGFDDRLAGARVEVYGLQEVVLGAPVGEVVETPAVGTEPDREVELVLLVRCQVAQRPTLDVEEESVLVHVAEEIDDRRTPPIGVPAGRVEVLAHTVEDKRLLAFGDVQQEN